MPQCLQALKGDLLAGLGRTRQWGFGPHPCGVCSVFIFLPSFLAHSAAPERVSSSPFLPSPSSSQPTQDLRFCPPQNIPEEPRSWELPQTTPDRLPHSFLCSSVREEAKTNCPLKVDSEALRICVWDRATDVSGEGLLMS